MITKNRPATRPTAVIVAIMAATLLFAASCQNTTETTADQESAFPQLSGAYLGQSPPGSTAEIFAPGIVSDGLHNRDIAITPEGDEIFFTSHVSYFLYSAILHTKLEDGQWTRPEVASFSTDARYVYAEPHISPDGKHLYYLSNMPATEGDEKNEDIWAVDRTDDGWGEPYNLGGPINTEGQEFFPSVTSDGTMYFTRGAPTGVSTVYRSRLVEGVYQEPEALPEQVNCGTNRFNAYIAPDESFIILGATGMPDTIGGVDYYIVFRDEQDNWSEPVNMGESVNTADSREYAASLSPDGNYLFFMTARLLDEEKRPKTLSLQTLKDIQDSHMMGTTDIFWVDAGFIEDLKPESHR